MKFKELEEKTYYRDRREDAMFGRGTFAYFEKIDVKKIEFASAWVGRTSIFYLEDGSIRTNRLDYIDLSKHIWNDSWYTIEFISKEEMHRRVIKYFWE